MSPLATPGHTSVKCGTWTGLGLEGVLLSSCRSESMENGPENLFDSALLRAAFGAVTVFTERFSEKLVSGILLKCRRCIFGVILRSSIVQKLRFAFGNSGFLGTCKIKTLLKSQ